MSSTSSSNRSIFIKYEKVISNFVIPWICGRGSKDADFVKRYKIQTGDHLNPDYYPANVKKVEEEGEEKVKQHHISVLYNDERIDQDLTRIAGQSMYVPQDLMSGIFMVEILPQKLGLNAGINGISRDGHTILILDKYLWALNTKFQEEIEIKMLAAMAVWKARKCIYYVTQSKESHWLNFNEERWNGYFSIVKEWAQQESW